jgi:hypothetical protein
LPFSRAPRINTAIYDESPVFYCFIVLLLAVPAGRAQSSTPQLSAKDDYSQEAAVIEELSTKIAFENDGKFTP